MKTSRFAGMLLRGVLWVCIAGFLAVATAVKAEDLAAENVDGLLKRNGEFTTVVGRIVGTHVAASGKVRFFNFSSDYKKGFTLVIFTGDLPAFTSAVGEPTKFYLMKKVRVQGRVKIYDGKPEIILQSPEQIEVLEGVPQSDKTVAVSDLASIKASIGQFVTVEGKVSSTHTARSGKVRFLNLGEKSQESLSLVIFTNDLPNFKDIGDPVIFYTGKMVRVQGIIQEFKGRAEIVVKDPQQMVVIQ